MPDVWTVDQYRHYVATGQAPTAAPVSPPGGGEPMAEAQLLAQVRRLAREHGWLCFHCYDSRRSEEGFPDIVLVKPNHAVIFAELKTRKGKLTHEQQIWRSHLEHAIGVRYFLWRPADHQEIYRILSLE